MSLENSGRKNTLKLQGGIAGGGIVKDAVSENRTCMVAVTSKDASVGDGLG
jgi:hypothetical protein